MAIYEPDEFDKIADPENMEKEKKALLAKKKRVFNEAQRKKEVLELEQAFNLESDD